MQRFALQTHDAYDGTAAMKFSLEHQNPFVTGAVTGGSAYSATTLSFLSITDPNVMLWALKPADDGISQGVRGARMEPGVGSNHPRAHHTARTHRQRKAHDAHRVHAR